MKPKLIQIARKLRKRSTPQETILWSRLRNRRLQDYKFRRQFPVGKYVVDFCCYEKRLVIELDGGQHNFHKQIKHDREKGEFFKHRGFKMLRFWNNDLKDNLQGVLSKILEALKE